MRETASCFELLIEIDLITDVHCLRIFQLTIWQYIIDYKGQQINECYCKQSLSNLDIREVYAAMFH